MLVISSTSGTWNPLTDFDGWIGRTILFFLLFQRCLQPWVTSHEKSATLNTKAQSRADTHTHTHVCTQTHTVSQSDVLIEATDFLYFYLQPFGGKMGPNTCWNLGSYSCVRACVCVQHFKNACVKTKQALKANNPGPHIFFLFFRAFVFKFRTFSEAIQCVPSLLSVGMTIKELEVKGYVWVLKRL